MAAPARPVEVSNVGVPQPSSAGGPPLALLWQSYRDTSDANARAELLQQYVRLVHFVAAPIRKKTWVEYDELVSAGALGLLAAIEGFDPARGFAFTTYAVGRIRGAILDDLRGRDWLPRSSRRRAQQLAATRARLQANLTRLPTPTEVARELGLGLAEYWRWCDELDLSPPDTLPAQTGWKFAGAPTISSREPAASEDQLPDQRLLANEERARVRAALADLPQRERDVLVLCYYEELTLKQAALVLGVTESRVCQLRRRALQRLSRLLGR